MGICHFIQRRHYRESPVIQLFFAPSLPARRFPYPAGCDTSGKNPAASEKYGLTPTWYFSTTAGDPTCKQRTGKSCTLGATNQDPSISSPGAPFVLLPERSVDLARFTPKIVKFAAEQPIVCNIHCLVLEELNLHLHAFVAVLID